MRSGRQMRSIQAGVGHGQLSGNGPSRPGQGTTHEEVVGTVIARGHWLPPRATVRAEQTTAGSEWPGRRETTGSTAGREASAMGAIPTGLQAVEWWGVSAEPERMSTE